MSDSSHASLEGETAPQQTPCPTTRGATVPYHHSWCEVDTTALRDNMAAFRAMVGKDVLLAAVIKSNAYGHELKLAARAFIAGGADWLCVHDLDEAQGLRNAGIEVPVYLMGPLFPQQVPQALALDVQPVLYDQAIFEALSSQACPTKPVRVHIKLETGNNRQGLPHDQALDLAIQASRSPNIRLEGISSHYANVEDTTDQSFARLQLRRYRDFLDELATHGIHPPHNNFSNSAATILWPDTWFDLVRVGISAYGMWPSKETYLSAVLEGRQKMVQLRPALTWKTRVAQIKDLPRGAHIGYGCSFKTTHPTRLAILPVGYRDGYDRRLSNLAHVLINGNMAPVRGRVCMNLVMVDITDAGPVAVGDPVVLMGDNLSAEMLAQWCNTINYEITTRIAEKIPRLPKGE